MAAKYPQSLQDITEAGPRTGTSLTSQAVTNPALKMKHERGRDEFNTEKIPGGQRADVQDTWLHKVEHEIHGGERGTRKPTAEQRHNEKLTSTQMR